MKKIAFIGLGIMGSRMASHLAKNNVNLTVYNRTEKELEFFKNENVTVANSIESAVKDADIVFSMLSKPAAVEAVFFGEEGALKYMKEDAIWADCSTVNPSFSKKSFDEAAQNKVRFIDSPVSGSIPQADNAELVFFVGGKKEVLSEVESLMDMMSKKVLNIGDTGKGSSFKIIVNMMLASNMLVFSEAVLFGDKMGISKDFLLDMLPNLIVSAPFTKFKAPAIKEDKYDPQFPLELMHKDLGLASLTAEEENHSLFLSNLTKELFEKAETKGMGRLDFSAIFKYLEELN